MTTATRTDVRLANEAWESVLTAHATLMSVFGAEDMWAEVSMREYDVLYTLAKSDGPMRISDLQGGVLLSQPAMSRLVDRLVARGLIDRCPDPVDKRAVRTSLTEEGARLQREVGRAHGRSVAREVSGALSPEEMRDLRRLCSKLAGSA